MLSFLITFESTFGVRAAVTFGSAFPVIGFFFFFFFLFAVKGAITFDVVVFDVKRSCLTDSCTLQIVRKISFLFSSSE